MGGFGQIMKNMLTWQPSGSPAWQRQQEEKIRQSQEQRAAQQADLDFHQHMLEIGALPVVNGLVKEQQPLTAPAMRPPDQNQPESSDSQGAPAAGGSPSANGSVPLNTQSLREAMLSPTQGGPYDSSSLTDSEGNPNPGATFGAGNPAASPQAQQVIQAMMPGSQAGSVTIVRKAEPSRTQKWKDATGDSLAYELPSPESQAWKQSMERRAQALQQQTAAEQQGTLDAQNRQRDQYGSPLDPDLAAKYGVDPNQKLLPAEKVQLATKYYPVVGAGLRGEATKTAAQLRAEASQYRTDLENTTKQAIADQSSMDRQDALDHHDKWAAALAAARGNAQTNLNARNFVNSGDRNMALHTKLLGDISKESVKQMAGQAALAVDSNGTPVIQDGEEFVSPFDGRKHTMNAGQRILLQNGVRQSQATVAGYRQNAATLETLRDQFLSRFAGGAPAPRGAQPSPASAPSGAPAGGGTPGAAPSSPAPAGPPSASVAPLQVSSPGRGPRWTDAAREDSGPHLTPGTPAPPRATARAAAAPGTPATPQQKVATRAQVNAYATKKGISAAAALQEFQTSGYTVQ